MAHDRKNKKNFIFEEFTPSAGWTEDSNCHYLLVDLPDFKKDEVKLQIDSHGHVMVSGERRKSENRFVHFEQTFKLPQNANMENITGKFEEEILYVTVPKQITQEEEEEEQENGIANTVEQETGHEVTKGHDETLDHVNHEKEYNGHEEHHHKEDDNGHEEHHHKEYEEGVHDATGREKWRNDEAGLLQIVMEKLMKNKGMVATAVLAFSLGVMVCNKFQSDGNLGSSLTCTNDIV